MKISVIVPTYQRPHLLSKCLVALSNQSFNKADFEVIVVSDGPDEDTKVIVNELRDAGVAARYLSLLEKKGPAAARNFGWLNARADIIAFTDDDCLPDTYWLSEIYHHINPDSLEAITGKVIVPRGKRPTDYEQNTAGLETADFVTANCACTKKALVKTGGFDEQFCMAWREDSELEFKLIRDRIPVRRIETAIIVHPVRETVWGVSIKEQKKTQYNALLFKKYPQLYRQKIQPTPPVFYYLIILMFILMLAGIATANSIIAITGLFAWVLLTLYFIVKRLKTTQLSARHIGEMAATSVVIPFLSIYWQWYGAFKYKVLFI